MPITKKYVELKINDDVVAILPICECSATEYLKKQQEAAKNYEKLLKAIQFDKNRIAQLEKEIKFLKGEE